MALRAMSTWIVVLSVLSLAVQPQSWAHETEEGLDLILTTATAQKDMTPDSASLSLEIVTQANTVKQASEENAKRMTTLLAAVKAHGWEELTMKTSRFSVNPMYEKVDRRLSQALPKILGYRVNNSLAIRLEELDGDTLAERVTLLFDEGLKLGANQVHGPSFYVKDPEVIQEQLLADAVREAARRAHTMATAAGVTIVRLHRLQDSPQHSLRTRDVYKFSRSVSSAQDSASIAQVQVGEQTISVTVSAAYEVAAP